MMARSKPRAAAPDDSADAEGIAKAAEGTAAERVNKSEAIRGEARAILDAGGQPRPSAIVRALESQGIAVAPAMVSTVLKKMGLERRPRRTSGSAARQPAASRVPAAPRREPAGAGATESSFTLHQLIAAKKFVEMVGSPRQAMALLDALDRLM
jgi:arginine repressor